MQFNRPRSVSCYSRRDTMPSCKHHPILAKRKRTVILPLLGALKDMRPDQRVIIMHHLDDETRDCLYEVIEHALCDTRLPPRRRTHLRTKLMPHKHDWRYIIDPRRPPKMRKKKLLQLGGGPFSHILRAAVPLLLDIFSVDSGEDDDDPEDEPEEDTPPPPPPDDDALEKAGKKAGKKVVKKGLKDFWRVIRSKKRAWW